MFLGLPEIDRGYSRWSSHVSLSSHHLFTCLSLSSALHERRDVRGAAHPLARARVLLAASDDGRRWWQEITDGRQGSGLEAADR